MGLNKVWLMTAVLLSTTVTAAEEKMLSVSKSLMPNVALTVAQAALQSCRKAGYQISVSVVDSAGNVQVSLRDQIAGHLTLKTAILKARTAISFRSDTATLVAALKANPENSGVKRIPGVLILGGGVVIQAGGIMLGAVGISGAPSEIGRAHV